VDAHAAKFEQVLAEVERAELTAFATEQPVARPQRRAM